MINAGSAREAAASAAADLVEPDMTIGLGSGRMVWRIADLLGTKGIPVQAVVASTRTHDAARLAGLPIVELDGANRLDLALDGADEVDSSLRMIKGAGGNLLREKIIASAASRFIVAVEARRRVDQLGMRCRLPVEIACFSWRETCRKLSGLLVGPELRCSRDGQPYLTDEGHYIVDCILPASGDLTVVEELVRIPGVVEHGLFTAARVVVGHPDKTVEILDTV